MRRWWRVLALSAAVGLSATGCGGDDGPPAASALPTPTAPTAGAGEFQEALDRLIIDRAVARTDRKEAAAEFNSDGSDRLSALTDVKAACAQLLQLYSSFAESMRRITFDEAAQADLDGVLGATGELVSVLAKYAESTSPEEFAEVNSEELVGTAVWEEAVRSFSRTIGATGLPASTGTASPAPTETASPTASPTESPSASPTESPTESATGSPSP